ncbi:MAG: carbon storage regulator CsrA [Clostridiales bacterium]|jgi:carbon storage regulator|nr:carbon storage regulator CsrA [Clostridiales bacterium]
MLVVTRKPDESVIIDGKITIKVLAIEDGKVKLGIDAPQSIKIYRQEVYEAIKKENEEAVSIGIEMLNNLPKKK